MISDTRYAIVAGLAILGFSFLIIISKPAAERRPVLDSIALLWLLAMLKPLLHPLLVQEGWLRSIPQYLHLMALPWLYGPLFYLYTRLLTRPERSLRVWEWSPPVVLLLIIMAVPLFRAGGGTPLPGRAPAPGFPGPLAIVDPFLAVIYSVLTFLLLRRHSQRVIRTKSRLSEMNTLGSGYLLLFLFFVLSLFLSAHRFLGHTWGLSAGENQELHGSGFLAMIVSFSLFLARQRPVYSLSESEEVEDHLRPPNLFADPGMDGSSPRESNSDPELHSLGGAHHSLPPEEEVRQLRQSIESRALFLDSDLTLESLARQLEMSRHRVSYLLNQGVQRNFYSYINGLRVEHAARLLRDPDYAPWPVLRIALESGFSSKATFNRLFKEYKGKTPNEWRRLAA